MPLHFSLASASAGTIELTADSSALATGAALVRQLEQQYGRGPYTVAGLPLDELTPGIAPLRHGAVVVQGLSTARSNPTPSLIFTVNTGPDSGQLYPLLRGSYEIGRTGCAISVNDPGVSRLHAVLTVAENHIELRDHNSTNGTWVDGVRIRSTMIDAGSRIHVGSSFVGIVPGMLPEEPLSVIDVQEPLTVGCPRPPEKNRTLIITAALPLVLGIALAVTTGMWFFLAFSGLSAVTGIIPLITGKRKRREFAAAVEAAVGEDTERRRRAAPDAAKFALAVRTGQLPARGAARLPPLRLGLADVPANIAVLPSQSGWNPPQVHSVPAVISVAPAQSVLIEGAREAVEGLGWSLLIQLSAVGAQTISFGTVTDLPCASRFLPGALLVTDSGELAAAIQRIPRGVVLVWGNWTAAGTALKNCEQTVIWLQKSSNETVVRIVLTPGSGTLRTGNTGLPTLSFVPDLLRRRTFDNIARALSAATSELAPAGTATIPADARLDAVSASSSEGIQRSWNAETQGLSAPLGFTGAGPLYFDLVAQGPHLLVAGTTGAGKSELLRSLILAIAAAHPPSTVNFLLIDFKGGSSLSVLSTLPHSVGLLTDLSAENVSRTLISLRAEIRRRERLFAEYGVSDLAGYAQRQPQTPLPRLVLVIDEFRMLTEEVPMAVAELMRIATLGRSLGIHLILSTQRPQGAVTSDIRANVTASISLRVQSALDSRDVLDDPAAAAIPVRQPGRAYLRVGNDPLVQFQVASTLGAADSAARQPPLVEFRTFLTAGSRQPADTSAADTQLGKMVTAITAAAAGQAPPFKPIAPPLPRRLAARLSESTGGQRETDSFSPVPVNAGLLDIPEEQTSRALCWNPVTDSHLALLGVPGSGGEEAMRSLAGQLTGLSSMHSYVLDGEGLLAAMAGLDSVGAHVASHEVKRAARTLTRISEAITERLARRTSTAQRVPGLLLIITGWGRWVSVLRSSRWAWAEDVLGDIVRDGGKAGVCVLISGDRELLGARFFSLIPNRIFLPHGSSPESLMLWPKRPQMDSLPGRAFVQGRIATAFGAVAQLSSADEHELADALKDPGPPPLHRPFRIDSLPDLVTTRMLNVGAPRHAPGAARGAEVRGESVGASEATHHPAGPAGSRVQIAVGVGGDELDVMSLLIPPRSVTAVLGGSGSGRTNVLLLLAAGLPPGFSALCPSADEDPVQYWASVDLHDAGQHPQALVRTALVRTLLLVDNADRLPPEAHQRLTKLHAASASVVFTAAPGVSLMSRVPLALEARSCGTGLVLSPQQASDADFFGVRLEVEGRQPPGRAYLIQGGSTAEIQLAWVPC